jgi:hypothetical protein
MGGNTGATLGLALVLACWLVPGAAGEDRKKGPSTNLNKEKPPKVEETIRDLAYVQMDTSIRVEGVGLVIGLNNTGSNPEPSVYRTKLLDRMRKAGVDQSESWLESPTTSLVLVKGTIPPGVTSTDKWDIQVELSPASTTTSLAGGFLMMTPLTVVQMVDGEVLSGQHLADAYGPLLLPDGANPRSARVLGGAKSRKEVPYLLVLKPERQGYRAADLLQKVVNLRFHQRKGVDQVGMATAKSPEHLVLNVPPVYHDNQSRYFQIIERLQVVDAPELRVVRMEKWSRELLDPKTAGQAALKLEGIGPNAIPALQAALASTNPQVKFFGAEALAYLHDPSGVDVLAETAASLPEFRLFALTALAAMDEPASSLRLQQLMSHPDPKVRYGAFVALRKGDPRNPYLGRVAVLDAPTPELDPDDPATDATAFRLFSSPRKTPRPEDPFELYVVDVEGPPLVHVTRSRRCEVVIFGRRQKLLTPVVLGGSSAYLINAAADDEKVEVSRVGAGADDRRLSVVPEVAEVVRAMANLGATYPEVLEVLSGADRQKNLAGPLVIDAMPVADEIYERSQLAGTDLATAKKDAEVARASSESAQSRTPAKKAEAPRPSLWDRFRLRRSGR